MLCFFKTFDNTFKSAVFISNKRLGFGYYFVGHTKSFSYRKSVRDRFVGEVFEMEITEIIDPDKLIKG